MSAVNLQLKRNLQILSEMNNVSEAELCRKTNVPQATLNRLLSGATDDPRVSTLVAIADFFSVSIDQLLGIQSLAPNMVKAKAETSTFIPILSWKNIKGSAILNYSEQKELQWIETEPSNKQCFGLKAEGESMWPQFVEGIILIVDPTIKAKHKDFVICYLHKEKETIFRQLIEENQYKILNPINHVFPPIRFTKNDRIIGVVSQARYDLKTS